MSKSKEKNGNKQLSFLKGLLVTALVCSLILTGFLIYSSTLTKTESLNQSALIKNFVKQVFGINETVVPQKISVDIGSLSSKYYFTNEKVKLPINVIPSNGSRDFEYSFSDDKCTVDEEGYISYSGTELTQVKVTVTSKLDPSVSCSADVLFRGIMPNDEAVESIGVEFSENGKTISPEDIAVGVKYKICSYLTIKDEYLEKYGLSSNKYAAKGLPFNILINGEQMSDLYAYHTDGSERYIIFLKEFSGEMGLRYLHGASGKFFYREGEAEPIINGFSIDVKEKEGLVYKPQGPIRPQQGTYDAENDQYVITVPVESKSLNIWGKEIGSGNDAMCRLEVADAESAKVAYVKTRINLEKKRNSGVCYVYMTSLFDESVRVKIKIVFEGVIAEELSIVGSNIVGIQDEGVFSTKYDKEIYGNQEIEWSIVEGSDLATIGSDGKLRPTGKGFGKVVIRAESGLFPELYDELTVDIRLWSTLTGFVRKMLGHFALFALLGIGYLTCAYLLIKRHRLSFLIAPAGVLAIAALTELIQYYTEGRGGTMFDVILNTCGGLCGISVYAALVAVIFAIYRRLRPESYRSFRTELALMSYRSFIKPKEENEAK